MAKDARGWWSPLGSGHDPVDVVRFAICVAVAAGWAALVALGVVTIGDPADVHLFHMPALALAFAATFAILFAARGRLWDLFGFFATAAPAVATLGLGRSIGAIALGPTAALVGLVFAIALPIVRVITIEDPEAG